MKLAPLGRARSQRGMDAKTCHPDASVDHAFSPCCFLVPGATDDIASQRRRTIADAAMHLHVPRGAASTGNIKVAFCQSFSVRSHKGHDSYRAPMCAVLGAAKWPTAGSVCSGMSPPRLQLISVLQLLC